MKTAVTIVVVASLLLTVGCHEDMRRIQTVSDIKMIYLNTFQLEYKRKATIEDILRNGRPSGSITNWNILLATAMLTQDPRTPALRTNSDGSVCLVDRWGQALEVRPRSEVQHFNAGSRMLVNTNSLLIWSKGPNAKNDYGDADDVFCEID